VPEIPAVAAMEVNATGVPAAIRRDFMNSRPYVQIWICLVILLYGNLVCGQDVQQQAIKLLASTKAFDDPAFAMGDVDSAKAHQAEQLWRVQMEALGNLNGTTDAAVIPILIPYLSYNVDLYWATDTHRKTDPDTLRKDFPALGIIMSIPGAAATLANYVEDTRNPINYKGTAFHALRYVDPESFKKVAIIFNKGIAQVNQETWDHLNAVEKGTAPFGGIYFYTASDQTLFAKPNH
jgi:hypothetical protein